MPPLLDLAIELRLRMYELLLESYRHFEAGGMALINPDQPSSEARETFKSLLLSCKIIYLEAAPTFYKTCTFYANHPYDFANTFLSRLAAEDVTTNKLVSIRHLELKLEASHAYNRPLYQCNFTKGERHYWMDLVRVFDEYQELGCLDSLVLTLTRTRSDIAFYLINPCFSLRMNMMQAWNAEREALHMFKAAHLLNRRHLSYLTPLLDVQDTMAQDMDPASNTYEGWRIQRIFKVMLLRAKRNDQVGEQQRRRSSSGCRR